MARYWRHHENLKPHPTVAVRDLSLYHRLPEPYPLHKRTIRPNRSRLPCPSPQQVATRLIGQRLSQIWHQPIIVDSKPSAAGSIGTDQVAKASANGYKLLITNNNTIWINPILLPNTPYAVARHFAQVTQLGIVPVVLVVNSNVKATSVKELVALAKASPGKPSYASSGSGSLQHLSAELFKSMTALISPTYSVDFHAKLPRRGCG